MEMKKIENKIEQKDEVFDIKIKHIFNDWALNSKTHGLSNIVRNRKIFMKFFWLICFLASFGYCK